MTKVLNSKAQKVNQLGATGTSNSPQKLNFDSKNQKELTYVLNRKHPQLELFIEDSRKVQKGGLKAHISRRFKG